MKKITTLLLAILSMVTFYSQNLNWGEEYVKKNKFIFGKLVGSIDGERSYTLYSKPKNETVTLFSKNNDRYYLDCFDKTNNKIYTSEIKIPAGMRYMSVEAIGGKLFLFLIDEKGVVDELFGGKHGIVVYEISSEGIVLEGSAKTIYTFNREYFIPKIMFSESKNYFMFFQPRMKKESYGLFELKTNVIDITVFNDKLNLVSKKEIGYDHPMLSRDQKGEYSSLTVDVKQVILDDKGNVHALTTSKLRKKDALKKAADNKAKLKEVSRIKYSIVSLMNSLENTKVYELDFPVGKWIAEARFNVDKNNLVLGGYYSSKKNEMKLGLNYLFGIAEKFSLMNELKGTFYCRIDLLTSKLMIAKTSKFSNETLTQQLNDKQIAKSRGLNGYIIKDLFLKKDGGVLCVSEHELENNKSITIGQGESTEYLEKVFSNIVISSISKDGIIEWTKVIYKKNISSNEYDYMSYFAHFNDNNGNLNVVFNDNHKNIETLEKTPTKPKIFFCSNGFSTDLVTINSEGGMHRKHIEVSKKKDAFFDPKLTLRVDEFNVLFLGHRNKKHKFTVVDFSKIN